MLTLYRSAQLKLNSDVNGAIKLSQKQIRAGAKQNDIRCQQCNKPGAIGRTEDYLIKGYELRTNYVKNTTLASVPVTWNKSHQLNIQTKNTYKRNNTNIA